MHLRVIIAFLIVALPLTAGAWNNVDIKSLSPCEVSAQSVAGEAPSYLPAGKNWSLVWHDEFNGTEIDKTKWMCRESFWGKDFKAFAHNYEGVEMTGTTVKLNLVRHGDDFCSPHLQTGSLTYDIPKDSDGFWPSGKYRKPLFMHRYGYYEIRCRQPKHPGWWSAFWLQAPGIGSSPDAGACGVETDVMENYTQFTQGKIIGGNGWGGYGKDSHWFGHFGHDYETMEDGWCYYGVDWTPNGYTFYVNGKMVGEQNEPVSHTEQFILMSTEPYNYRQNPSVADKRLFMFDLPEYFEVDFVRVYDEVSVPAEDIGFKCNTIISCQDSDSAVEAFKAGFKKVMAPACQEVFEAAKGTLIAVFTESGKIAGAEISAAVESSGLKPSRLIVASYRIDALTAFHRKHPEYRTMWLLNKDRYPDYQCYTRAEYAGVDYVSMPASGACFSFAQGLRDRGIGVIALDVNSAEAFKAAYDLRAEGVCTLSPDQVKEWSGQIFAAKK